MPAFDPTFEDTVYFEDSITRSLETSVSSVVSILHFNDCYNVEPRSQEPSGGAARLVTAFNKYSDSNTLVLFSGDIMAPSISQSIE